MVFRYIVFVFILLAMQVNAGVTVTHLDSLPRVFQDEHDVLHSIYRHKALRLGKFHQPPTSLAEWEKQKPKIRKKIIAYSGVKFYHDLPLNMKETGHFNGDGFSVKNIFFQTQPGIEATANLYIPQGSGKFPAVVLMMGHSSNGKLYANYQLVGQSLAKNGYVVLAIDPWGAGERTTIHGEFEYHGSALGATLYNVGETLLGMQLTDNIRAVDLLTSLPYVDKTKIGATGASGGGNQTMWLAAIDERIKAAMPVVSVGTFQSYAMAHNCVCEVLPKGLESMEEWAVLGLVAPRAIKMSNHDQESNPTFYPSEMLKSFALTKPIFQMYGAENNVTYQCFDRPHGYFPEDREAAIGWFDLHLKGIGDGKPKKELPTVLIEEDKLLVFKKGQRPNQVQSTASFSTQRANTLKNELIKLDKIDIGVKRDELKKVLGIKTTTRNAEQFYKLGETAGWEQLVMETADQKMIPILLKTNTSSTTFAIITHADRKKNIELSRIDSLSKLHTIVVADLSGTGEASSFNSKRFDNLAKLHTYSRAALWLGETVMGNWVEELRGIVKWIQDEKKGSSIYFYGYKESALAGVFLNALEESFKETVTYSMPMSLQFDQRKGVDYFGLNVYIPNILPWGDIQLALAMGNGNYTIFQQVSIAGRLLNEDEKTQYKSELSKLKTITKSQSNFHFR